MENEFIMRIDFTKLTGGVYKEEYIALWDKRDYTEEKARRVISGYDSYPGIIILPKDNFEIVFRSFFEK